MKKFIFIILILYENIEASNSSMKKPLSTALKNKAKTLSTQNELIFVYQDNVKTNESKKSSKISKQYHFWEEIVDFETTINKMNNNLPEKSLFQKFFDFFFGSN